MLKGVKAETRKVKDVKKIEVKEIE